MDVHVSIVGEATRGYTNMMKLLVYSLRENGGALSDAPVTVSTNARAMPMDDRREIEALGSVRVRVMPRQHGEHFADKVNAYYAAPEEADVLVYLDCDTVVLNPLDEMVSGLDPATPTFRARRIGPPGARSAGVIEPLLRDYALTKGRTLDDVADDRFPRGYPMFNGGVLVMTQPARAIIREDAAEIAYDLYAQRARTSVSSLPEILREIGYRILDRLFPERNRSTYEYWVVEQLGLALSVIKNDIPYDLLDPTYNWVHPEPPADGELPAVFHYMSGRHDVDRERLLDGDWIETFATSESPTRRALASLARRWDRRAMSST